MLSEWYHRDHETTVGPVSWEQLVESALVGQIKATDFVRQGDGEWVKAENVNGLIPQDEVSPATESDAERASAFEPTLDWDISSDGYSAEEPVGDSAGNFGSGNIHFEEPARAPGTGDSDSGIASRIVRTLVPGSLLGKYEILEPIGEGGMGTVFKARHVHMDRIVALKILRTRSTKAEGAIERFHQEIRAVSRLNHPNIVTAHDADEFGGVHFLVMEYVDGVDLDEMLASKKKLPYQQAVEFISQAAAGLAYAHREGVIHRDIKPGNLMIDQRGVVKILDMGLAFIKEATNRQGQQQLLAQVTQADQILGTFDYMSPEQGEDPHAADHRADIYSLGCTLFKLVTGQSPYRGATTIQMIFAHREHPIPTMSALCSEVPFDLDAIFGKMVAKKREMRYQSMEEVIADLDACRKSQPISAWQTGEWGQTKADTERSLDRGGASRIEPSTDDTDDDDDYMLAPISKELGQRTAQKPSQGSKKTSPQANQAKDAQQSTFYLRVMGEEIGPFTLVRLRQENINPWDEVRREHSDRWVLAQEIEGLFD